MIWGIIKRRWWLLVLLPAVAVGTTWYLTSKITPVYLAKSTLLVDYRRPVQGDTSGEGVPAAMLENYINTLVSIVTSRPVANRVVDDLDLTSQPKWQNYYRTVLAEDGKSADTPEAAANFEDWLIGIQLRNVSAVAGDKSNLIEIAYRSVDREFSAAAANAFAQAFTQTIKAFEVNPALASVESADSMTQNLREELEAAQSELSKYQQRTGIVATDERLDVETARLEQLATQRSDAEQAARAAQGRLAQLDRLGDDVDSKLDLPEVRDDGLVRNLQLELGQKQSELAELSTTLGSNHPNYRRAVAEVASVRRKINATVTDIVDSLKLEAEQTVELAETARKAEQEQRDAMLELKTVRDGMQPLLRDVENARANYDKALELFSQYSIYANLNQTNIAIVNNARVPNRPVKPNSAMNLALAMLASLIIAVALVYLWEMVDSGIRSREQIEEEGELIVLGQLPRASE